MTAKTVTKTRIDATSSWEPYPLPKETIKEGDPNGQVHWLRVSGAGEAPYYAGIWTCQPSVFDYRFELNESLHVLEGHVVVSQEGGPTIDMRPGDVVSFPKGAMTRWAVKAPFKKVFVDTP